MASISLSVNYNYILSRIRTGLQSNHLEDEITKLSEKFFQYPLSKLELLEKEALFISKKIDQVSPGIGDLQAHLVAISLIEEFVPKKTELMELEKVTSAIIDEDLEIATCSLKQMSPNNPYRDQAYNIVIKGYYNANNEEMVAELFEEMPEGELKNILAQEIFQDSGSERSEEFYFEVFVNELMGEFNETQDSEKSMQHVAKLLQSFSIEELEEFLEESKLCEDENKFPSLIAKTATTFEKITTTLINSCLSTKKYVNIQEFLKNDLPEHALESAFLMPKESKITSAALYEIAKYYLLKGLTEDATKVSQMMANSEAKRELIFEIAKLQMTNEIDSLRAVVPFDLPSKSQFSTIVNVEAEKTRQRADELMKLDLSQLNELFEESKKRLNIFRLNLIEAHDSKNQSAIQYALDKKLKEINEQILLGNIIEVKKAALNEEKKVNQKELYSSKIEKKVQKLLTLSLDQLKKLLSKKEADLKEEKEEIVHLQKLGFDDEIMQSQITILKIENKINLILSVISSKEDEQKMQTFEEAPPRKESKKKTSSQQIENSNNHQPSSQSNFNSNTKKDNSSCIIS